jgi:hypothetical protein
MQRTKWMRLAVRDLGDVIRWAGAQQAREIGEFRYRVVNDREIVSFRLVPNYAIEIGVREIIVVAHARARGWRVRARRLRRLGHALLRRLRRPAGGSAALPAPAASLPPHRIATLRPLSAAGWPARRPL